VARELHDEAGQVLAALALHLKAFEDSLPEGESRSRLADRRRSINTASASLCDLATTLRPSGLREQGLESSFQRQADRAREAGAAGYLPKTAADEELVRAFAPWRTVSLTGTQPSAPRSRGLRRSGA
jgi:nitrate/nitrite-specific signal transduction histidine kinase